MVLWACLSLPLSAKEHSHLSMLLLIPARSRLSAAVIRIRQFIKPEKAQRYLLSLPAAVLFWNYWKARPCPALPPWNQAEENNENLDCSWQLENAQHHR